MRACGTLRCESDASALMWFLPQVPKEARQLHEVDGEMSVVPGQKKLPRWVMSINKPACSGGGSELGLQALCKRTTRGHTLAVMWEPHCS